ncbi:MAG: glycosyltransferase family 2 protein, partial [Acidimicrobiia bacterium]|nr:glycosyltransferase family 2 protein [Acidimicrobiia bacterium]
GTLTVAHSLHSAPPAAVELALLIAANAAATLLRFLLLRRWVFRKA